MGRTYQGILPHHILTCEPVAIVIDKIEWSSNLRFSNSLRLLGYPFPCHALLLVCEIGVQCTRCSDEEDGSCEVERLNEPLTSASCPNGMNKMPNKH